MPTTVKAKKKRSTSRSKTSTPTLNYYKVFDSAKEPVYATDGSAGFDISCCLEEEFVTIYNLHNEPRRRDIVPWCPPGAEEEARAIHLNPGDRVMVPTGIVLDIPKGHYVRLFARSGLSLYSGLRLVNSVGIIDSDYKEQLYVLIENSSSTVTSIADATRICQGIMCKAETCKIEETTVIPESTTRDGGFGSTGTEEVTSEDKEATTDE